MGFFTSTEIAKKANKKVDINNLEPDCLKCTLYKQCKTPKMKVSGEGRKKILVISDSPNYEEDDYGIQLVGDEGKLLKKNFKKIKLSLNKDCWKINAVNCRTPNAKKPSHKEIKCCFPYVQKAILELRPKLILLLGDIAITSVFGEEFSNRKIDRWRAYEIPDEKFKCFVMSLYHPSYLLKRDKDANLKSVFKRDVKRISHCLKRTYEKQTDYESYVTILKDFNAVKSVLKRIIKRKSKIAFDYETTGLKPYRDGHKISTIGIAVSAKKAFAFPFNYKSYWTKEEFSQIYKLWKTIILDKKIKKIIHNSKFEDAWSAIRAGGRIKNIHWDTMMSQHILDNRRASIGLKFQTFVRYGVRPYDNVIKPFLKSKNGEFNTIEKAPFKELLIYNGLDCIFCWMLYKDQTSYLPRMKNMFKAYKFFMRGLSTMGTIQFGGINVDMKYYKETNKKLKKDIRNLQHNLITGREGTKFKEKFGRDIKITSNQDLGKLFYEILGKNPIYTDAGNYKTDKPTLEKLNLPFIDKLLKMKRLEKAKGTYLAQFAREAYKGVMHPFFDLHIPVSYRGSSSMPNFQNVPKRDAEIAKLIRKGMVPSTNSAIIEADFSGAEVITSVCYHKDKNFYNYLVDPSTDMHRDNATDLLLLPHETLERTDYTKEQKKKVKMIRFFAKNMWTFAQFYGDWFGSCGKSFWENVVDAGLELPSGMTCKQWLEDKGIYELGEIDRDGPTPGSFLEHCKNVEDKMWNERFSGYTQWKSDIVDFYQEYGYIETYFGFRFQGYMDKKQCTNFPIQGCLQGHSKILTSKGWKRIDSLINKKVKVWTGFEWKPAIGVDRGKAKLATVHLESGLKLDCDIRHEFKNENNEWVKFKDLKVGHYVALPKIMNRITNSKIKMDWFFILGFAIGDGWFGSKMITENNTRYVLQISGGKTKYNELDEMCSFLQSYHAKGFTKARVRQTKKNMRVLHVEGRKMAEKLISFGYECNKTAHTKHIPISIWDGTKQQQQQFMNGLWLSDGSRKRKSLHMCNFNLLQEVQVLLYGLGYDSFIRKTKNGWKLTPQNVLHKTFTSRLFPRKTFDMLRKEKTIAYDKNDNSTITDRRNIASNKDVSQTVAERILNKLNPNCELYRYDRVTKIDLVEKEENTYTMTVNDKLHQFVADGIICKNTSFHLLVYTLSQVEKFIKKHKLRSKMVGQIHDSIILDARKDEISFLVNGINTIVQGLQDKFDWLMVPMEIEVELSKLKEDGGSFAEMNEYSIAEINKMY